MIEEKKVIVDSREVFYLIKPSIKPAATVVFVHGFPFSSEMWRPQLAALPENIQGVAFDNRGFGKSTTPHSFFSVDLFARDLLVFLETMELKDVIICGLSMGGYIALRTLQINSGKIAGLILCDTNSIADTDESKLKRFSSIDLIVSGKKQDFASGFLTNIFYEETFKSNPQATGLIKQIILNTSDSTICAAQLALASRTDTSSVLPLLGIPTLIIRGAYDKIMTEAQAVQLNEGIRGSELVIIPNAGHMSNLENTPVFNFNLLNFLSKHFC